MNQQNYIPNLVLSYIKIPGKDEKSRPLNDQEKDRLKRIFSPYELSMPAHHYETCMGFDNVMEKFTYMIKNDCCFTIQSDVPIRHSLTTFYNGLEKYHYPFIHGEDDKQTIKSLLESKLADHLPQTASG